MKSEALVPINVYLSVFVGLIVLTMVTAGVSFLDLGGNWNTVVALVIAAFKAILVILYFMHVRYSRPLTWIVVGAGFCWLAILIVLTASDVLTRR
ncbi:MAG TPA: cytochrome C oxidase subunit IV family protein [Candidatus Binatia bacterium]|jgi:cytochrome c oxidase subunit 4